MKLRFRKNSLRLRVNQREVETLAAGSMLEERVHFPGGASLAYSLERVSGFEPNARFEAGTIRVSVPSGEVARWADGDEIGLYFELEATNGKLKIAIEKDLVCIDRPEEERDPDAFPRMQEPSRCEPEKDTACGASDGSYRGGSLSP